MQVKSDGTKVLKVGKDTANKFQKQINITNNKVIQIQEILESQKQEYQERILSEIFEAKKLLDNIRSEPNSEYNKTALCRIILAIKSNAGMFDMELISDICSLCFDIFDENYPLDSKKVQDGIELYLDTLVSLLNGRVEVSSRKETMRLISEFQNLNAGITF